MAKDEYAEVADGFDRVAAGWEKWTHASTQRNASRYFDPIAITPRDRVLEIGAGAGDQTIAKRCIDRRPDVRCEDSFSLSEPRSGVCAAGRPLLITWGADSGRWR